MGDRAWIKVQGQDGGDLGIDIGGSWTIEQAETLAERVDQLEPQGCRSARLELSGLEDLDTVGVLLLLSARERLEAAGAKVELACVREDHRGLIEHVERARRKIHATPEEDSASGGLGTFTGAIAGIGRWIETSLGGAQDFVRFIGLVLESLLFWMTGRRALGLAATVHQMEEVWLKALPIIGLLGLVSGMVMAYQASSQLGRLHVPGIAFKITAIALLREIGVLLPTLIVAGRSGSSFAAEIGTMGVRQELNAMRVFGMEPVTVLVLPRLLALIVTLPLLCVYGDLVGLAGGGLIAWSLMDTPPGAYIAQLATGIGAKAFLIGIVKAPFFGALIALVGCYQGLRVGGSSAEVGQRTTLAVVHSIFLVIVLDGIFSVVTAVLGI
jgi:phospholipid/cholesterol/gamma-HCH transport system permease protein